MEQSFLTCLEHHVSCGYGTSDLPNLPTRIIDVGNHTTPPRLVSGFPTKGRWIALSHCWGGIVDYTLTKDNLNSRCHGMPLNELPATFRDAVLVTRNLNVPYLWIDAICIIQDSLDDDWPKEASRMQEYYMNSVLTISAMNAENSRKGILQKRLPRFKPLMLSLKSERLAWEGTVAIRESHPKTMSFWQRNPVSALTTRGWTLQENCLPPRTLHFTRSGLVWECLCHTVVEWLHDPEDYGAELKLLIRPYVIDDENKKRMAQPGREEKAFKNTTKQSPVNQIYASWDEIVRFYSERKLTYSSDKLPAISGIASLFSTMLRGDRYLAGLWESRLLEGLCWHICSFDNIPRSRLDNYRAPSWSWASIDGEILLNHSSDTPEHGTDTQYQAKILEAHVECEPHNAFGKVKGGFLRLRGLWLPVYLDMFPEWDEEEGTGTFHFVLQEMDHNGGNQQQTPMHLDLWEGHVRTQWLDILDPSHYSCLNSRQVSPESASLLEGAENSDECSTDGNITWEKDAANWTCVPFARLDIAPTKEEFLGVSKQFRMGVMMLSESYFLLLQPNKHSPDTFTRIGIASASWVRGRRFSNEYIEKNTRVIVIT
ncbi:HET-domain-containing protein [Zopfia rhizophila CBS 207.26]|uniref:HET-domain-containing protein n=1 Tax=Zopfia rhizophila CBS 207.26 TaxID=1314779 RepID=A0A6A6E2T6_9PEZI|nr:HET-domain-containing protein [Zopfia rhizophila CBS 207.26]